MVVGTSGDPATPLVSARNLASTLGGASLVTARGSRHTAFASGNACVDAAVTEYLDAPEVGARGEALLRPSVAAPGDRRQGLRTTQICSAGHRRAHFGLQP